MGRQRRYPLGERTEDAASAAGRPGAGRKEADIGVKSAIIMEIPSCFERSDTIGSEAAFCLSTLVPRLQVLLLDTKSGGMHV